jgi:hypothetical protein
VKLKRKSMASLIVSKTSLASIKGKKGKNFVVHEECQL